MRVAWNTVSVVDPLFTLPLLFCVVVSLFRHSRTWAIAGLVWIFIYLSFGWIQHSRATAAAQLMAEQLGHEPQRLSVKPGFANLILWKSVYQNGDMYHVDAIRVTTQVQACPGDEVEVLNIAKHLPDLDPNSQQAADIERFRWFSNDYLAPWGEPGNIIDIRYAAVPNDINPLWGIRLDLAGNNEQHAEFITNRRTDSAQTQALWDLLQGHGCHTL